MARFVTFYSYKGGVGRTLALANVAWLLANHPIEPARVLVIDFDLGAPGLPQVFNLQAIKKRPGLVDYVIEYLDSAAVPAIGEFIHHTSDSRIDILHAGKMGPDYQRKLERLDWKVIYSSAAGYAFMERMKADINGVKPEYDYVLIDSLTGYSDVGGICVRQLSDSLVFLFRLNEQNLDGIRTVYHSLRADPGGEEKPVVPVITPSWPFLDEAAVEWTRRAQKLFSGTKLLEISFDSGLSFGERIVSKSANKLPLTSKVLSDYKNLASELRAQNPADALTLWNNLQNDNLHISPNERIEMIFRLLRRRPTTFAYWEHLPQVAFFLRRNKKSTNSTSSLFDRLTAFVDSECEHRNKFALFGRAAMSFTEGGDESIERAIADLNQALEIDHSFSEARIQRGYCFFFTRRFRLAIEDFTYVLNAVKDNESLRSRLKIQIAEAYLTLFDIEQAFKFVRSSAKRTDIDSDYFLIRGKILYLKGLYEEALNDIRRYVAMEGWNETAMLLPAQILAASGRTEEARAELESTPHEERQFVGNGNLAEAYLAVDPSKTLELLPKINDKARPHIKLLLECIAKLFLGERLEVVRSLAGPLAQERSKMWDPFEVVAMLRAHERNRTLPFEVLSLGYEIVRSFADEEIAEGIGPSVTPLSHFSLDS